MDVLNETTYGVAGLGRGAKLYVMVGPCACGTIQDGVGLRTSERGGYFVLSYSSLLDMAIRAARVRGERIDVRPIKGKKIKAERKEGE